MNVKKWRGSIFWPLCKAMIDGCGWTVSYCSHVVSTYLDFPDAIKGMYRYNHCKTPGRMPSTTWSHTEQLLRLLKLHGSDNYDYLRTVNKEWSKKVNISLCCNENDHLFLYQQFLSFFYVSSNMSKDIQKRGPILFWTPWNTCILTVTQRRRVIGYCVFYCRIVSKQTTHVRYIMVMR